MAVDLGRFSGLSEQERLERCAREAIRTPGRIQSHGRLLGVDPSTSMITLISENASGWLGRHVADLGSPTLEFCVTSGSHVDPTRVELDGELFDAIAHPAGDRVIIELEPAAASTPYARTSVVGAIQRLSTIADPDLLRAATAREIRAITGFDRVMVYNFFDDAHGEVSAEARADDIEPYLGLHFPASDIPLQARQLYVTKLSRAIVSTSDEGSALLALDEEEAAAVDLSLAELRAVSPHHIEFMRNMGQESTVSLSLVSDGVLHGMITCAHRTERRLPVLLRRALEVLAIQVSLQLTALAEIERLRRAVEVRVQRTALLAPLLASSDVAAALFDAESTVLDLVEADAVVLRVGDEIRAVGDLGPAAAGRLVDALGTEPISTDALSEDHPALAPLVPGFAGMLALPLAGGLGSLVFLRYEVARVVNWLGDQTPANRLSTFSPRLSFSAWRESVSGRSLPWGTLTEEAGDLARELTDAIVRREQSRLAELALTDALTGLHNRRRLVDLLGAPADPPESRALLYVDLDDFKRINDTFGHDTGDAVLAEVARRLVVGARATDTVIRLGGDEFVIVCDGIDHDAALIVAQRVLDAIAVPIPTDDGPVSITASCGVRFDGALDGDGLLEGADSAMYRAKRGGRNRVSE